MRFSPANFDALKMILARHAFRQTKGTDLHLAFPQNLINISTRFFVPEDSCRFPEHVSHHFLSFNWPFDVGCKATSTLFEDLFNNQPNIISSIILFLAPFKDSPLSMYKSNLSYSSTIPLNAIRQMNRDQLLSFNPRLSLKCLCISPILT